MKTVSVSTTIARPRAEVHAILADLPAHERFTDHFLVDWRVIGDNAVRVRIKGVGKHDQSEFRLVEITPERIVEHGKGGKDLAKDVRGIWTLGATPDGRTKVTFTNELNADRLADKLAWPFAKAWLKRNNGRAVERLREQLEQAPV